MLQHWYATETSPVEGGRSWHHFLMTLHNKCVDSDDETLWTAYNVLKLAYENARRSQNDRKALHQLLGLAGDPTRTARDYYLASMAQNRLNRGAKTKSSAKESSAFQSVADDFTAHFEEVYRQALEDGRATKEFISVARKYMLPKINERMVERAYRETYKKKHPAWKLMADPEMQHAVIEDLWDLITPEPPADVGPPRSPSKPRRRATITRF